MSYLFPLIGVTDLGSMLHDEMLHVMHQTICKGKASCFSLCLYCT